MDILKMMMFLAVMLIMPYCTGAGLLAQDKNRTVRRMLERWNLGMLLMYAFFEMFALAGTFAKLPLSTVGACYLPVIFLIILWGIYRSFRMGERKQGKFSGFTGKIQGQDKAELLITVLILACIAYQMIYVCMNMYVDDDDAYYVGTAVTSWYTNTISVYHPYTGIGTTIIEEANYALSPYPVYWAMWAKIFGLHPAIIMRSALPAVNIAWCYVVYYLLACTLFKGNLQRLWFMVLVNLVNMFGAYSDTSAPVFLMQRVWQGKSLIAAIMVPLLWYIWIRLRRNPKNNYLWFLLGASVWASMLCSTTAIFVEPILLGAFGLEYLIEKRDIKTVSKLVICALPLLFMAICEGYLLYLR